MSNPDPARITDPMWRLWTDRPNLLWKLSGIYADKSGYHNTVLANLDKWPGNYSIKLPLDLGSYLKDKARAIDQTMSDSEMVQWTTRMMHSALDPLDHRLDAVREFYGTLDNRTVYGLIKDNIHGTWRHSTSNLTHLFHGHISIFTAFVNEWQMLSPILSVEAGETLNEWRHLNMLPQSGDIGEEVKYWQYLHNKVREEVGITSPAIIVDGTYGPKTAAAFVAFWRAIGGRGSYSGEILTGSLALEYQNRMALVIAKVNNANTPPPAIQIAIAVDEWFKNNANNLPKFTVNGEVFVRPYTTTLPLSS